jgi:UDP-glucose 4-epimerase
MLLGLEKTRNQVEIYNIGSEDQTNVKTIAEIVVEEMKLKNVKLKFTGGVDGVRGWKGDVKNMLLDISKIKTLEWKLKLNSRQAVKKTARTLIQKRSEKQNI